MKIRVTGIQLFLPGVYTIFASEKIALNPFNPFLEHFNLRKWTN